MTQASTSGYKGYDRSFCIRMKSTLTKRGCHFKSSGYRVSFVKRQKKKKTRVFLLPSSPKRCPCSLVCDVSVVYSSTVYLLFILYLFLFFFLFFIRFGYELWFVFGYK